NRGDILVLFACLASGSQRHWELFVEATRGVIATTVRRTLSQLGHPPPHDVVDDLVQDTYLKIWANDCAVLHRFHGDRPEALAAYLRSVVCNVTRDYLRANLANNRSSRPFNASTHESTSAAPEVCDDSLGVDRQLLLEQIDHWFTSRAPTQVVSRDRWIFWLYYRDGLTTRAIADIPAAKLSQKGVES